MKLRYAVPATLLAGCLFNSPPHHAPDVPAGVPFLATLSVGYDDMNEPYGASGCVAVPATWSVALDAGDQGWLTPVDPATVSAAIYRPVDGVWHCFSANTEPTRTVHVWITPDTEGAFTLTWIVENDAWAWYTDRLETEVTVHAFRADEDLDGVDAIAEGGTDCDDHNAGRYPGAVELCDGLDQDCDEILDNGAPDVDGDGRCDERDFRVSVGELWPGYRSLVLAERVEPLSTVTLVLSTQRSGAPVCLPGVAMTTGAPVCTDLIPAQYVRSKVADANGLVGWFGVPVPRNVRVGTTVYAQAFWTLNGVGDATPVVATTVTAPPPP